MDLNVITVNIRFNNPHDGVNAWPHRKNYLADILQGHSPHIIATQEGREAQLREMESTLSDFELVAPHREWIPERMYPSFFLKKNTFEILYSFDKWLSETPDVAGSKSFESTFPRLMTGIIFRAIGSDKEFFLVNTHFDHIKGSTRIEQAKVLCQEIQKILEPQHFLILLGDYNDSPDSEPRKQIASCFPQLFDTWEQFNQEEETSHHGFNSEINAGSRIDWILADKRLTATESYLDKSHKGDLYPSDHYPVIAKLKV